MARTVRWGPVIMAAVLAAAGTSYADSSQADKAAARALFDEGRRLVGLGKHAEACPKFEESKRLDPGIGTMFNLADCLEATGKTASAWSMFLEVAAMLKSEGGQPEKEQAARKRAAALEPKLSKLKIVVPEAAVVPGLVVTRNGSPQGKGSWGVSIPVDPGVHVIEAVAPGHGAWTQSIELAKAGADVTVTVGTLQQGTEAGGPPVAAMPVPPAQPAEPADARPEAPAAAAPARGPRVHDGLYLRLAIGGAAQVVAVAHGETTKSDGTSASPDVAASGTSIAAELALGYAVRPGLNLGGGVFLEHNTSAVATIEDEKAKVSKLGTQLLVGPVLDWYFRPQKGFHMMVAAGLAAAPQRKFTSASDREVRSTPIGVGGSLGLGYEWWVGKEWSLGMLGRLGIASMVDANDANASHATITGAALMTVTFN